MADDKGVFYHPETGEILNGLQRSLLTLDGRFEIGDPVPMAPPVKLPDPARGMREMVQRMIREEFSQLAEMKEMETFEEADDFDVEEDPLPPPTDAELMALEGEARSRERRAEVERERVERLRAAQAAPEQPGGASGATGGAAPPSPATTSQATAAAPVEPIVKRSESASGTVAPGPKGS